MYKTPRISSIEIMSMIHNSRGLTYTDILKKVCTYKGLDFDEHKRVFHAFDKNGAPVYRYVKANRGVSAPTIQNIISKYTTKIGNRYVLNFNGVEQLYSSK